MKTAHDQLALQPSGQCFVAVAELGKCPLDHIDRVDPPEQRGVSLGDLERDLGPLPRVGGELQSLLEMKAGGLAPGARLRPGQLAQDVDSPRSWRRFGQRAGKQPGGDVRGPAAHGCSRCLAKARQHPLVARRADQHEMRRDLPGRAAVAVKHACRRAVCRVTAIDCQRFFERSANDGVNQPRRVVSGQHLQPYEVRDQP